MSSVCVLDSRRDITSISNIKQKEACVIFFFFFSSEALLTDMEACYALLRWSHDQEVNLVVLASVAGSQLITLNRFSLLHIYDTFITHLLHIYYTSTHGGNTWSNTF